MDSRFHSSRSRIIPLVQIEHGGVGINIIVASLATQELPYKIMMVMVKDLDFVKIVQSIREFLQVEGKGRWGRILELINYTYENHGDEHRLMVRHGQQL